MTTDKEKGREEYLKKISDTTGLFDVSLIKLLLVNGNLSSW